jgi:uncharacterized protein YggU (UPF0235/DUF167 family)
MTRLPVHVKLFARVSEVKSLGPDGRLCVALNAAPRDGEANAELMRVLAEFFDVPRSNVLILAGHRSRNKDVALSGITPDVIAARCARDHLP